MALPRERRTRRQPAPRSGFFLWLAANTGALQALAALTAIPIGVVAAVFALLAFRDQQQVNRDQISLNQVARQRFERRYASRVAWWIDQRGEVSSQSRLDEQGRLPYQTMSILNRSPVPISDVTIVAATSTAPVTPTRAYMWWLDDLRPCEQVLIALNANRDQISRLLRPDVEVGLGFRDPVGFWTIDHVGLSNVELFGDRIKATDADPSVTGPLEDMFNHAIGLERVSHGTLLARDEVTDCGESG